MSFNIRRLIDVLLLSLYGHHSKLTIYLRNQQVKAGFRGDSSRKPIILTACVIAGFSLFFMLLWILIKNIPSTEKIENTIPPPPSENQQVAPKQNAIVTTTIETYKEALPFAKEDEEKVEKNQIEVNNEVEVMEEVVEARNEEEEIVELRREVEKEDNNAGDVIGETYMRVLANNVNIRTQPSLESDIIARLTEGYMVKKIDGRGDWIFVDPGEDFKGWIYYDLLENVTADDYKSWENDSNQPVIVGLTRKDMDNPDNLKAEKKKIEKLLHSWKAAWEEKSVEKYMSFYSKAFTKADYNWEGYKRYKKNIFSRPGAISIELENIKINWDNFLMIVSFIQKYQSGSINSARGKMLSFQQENGSWKIVREVLFNRN